MAQQRMAVEWGFGLVKSKWKLISRKVSKWNKTNFPVPTECLILLATPKFPYLPESRKIQSPELATL